LIVDDEERLNVETHETLSVQQNGDKPTRYCVQSNGLGILLARAIGPQVCLAR